MLLNKGHPVIDFTRPTSRPRALILKRLAQFALAFYLILLVYMSLVPTVPGVEGVSDKLLHFIAYGALTALAAAAWPRVRLITLFIAVSIVGVILELGQGLLDIGRMASAADQLANMCGVALALAVWVAVKFGYESVRRK